MLTPYTSFRYGSLLIHDIGWTWLFEMKCNVEVGEELFLKEKAKFTDTTGLFGVKSALAWWYSEPSSNREGGPKLA